MHQRAELVLLSALAIEKNANAYHALGNVYEQSGQKQRAYTTFRTATEVCDNAPASVYVGAETEMIWINRIVARVMSGAVMREEGRLQAAAAQLIAGKRAIMSSAASGDVADVLSYLIADVNWVKQCNL